MRGMMTGVANKFKSGPSPEAFYNTLAPLSEGQHVTAVNDSSWYLGDGDKSISFNFRCTGINSTISVSGNINGTDYCDIFINGSGHLSFRVLDATASLQWTKKVETNFNDSTWRSALCVFDGWGTGQVYIDGVLQATTDTKTGTVTDISPATNLIVGANSSLARYNGELNNFSIHDGNLTQGNATELYGEGIAMQPWEYSPAISDNYSLAWPLNNGVTPSQEEEDSSSNGNDGTLVGSSSYTGEKYKYIIATSPQP